MNVALVMTILGPDRPGLVESVARLITDHGGNWLESRMSRLGGQFAGLLRVQVPRDKERALTQALQALASRHLTVVVLPDRQAAVAPSPTFRVLEIVGQDRPGIVRQISQALAQHGVNVEELHTECDSAPMSGETLFKARAKVALPPSCNLAALQKDLERIAADLMVDVSIEALPAD